MRFIVHCIWPLSLLVGPSNTLSNQPKVLAWVRPILFSAMPGFRKCLFKPPFPIKVKQSWCPGCIIIIFRTSLFLLDDPKNFTQDELGPFFILLFTLFIHLHFIYFSLCNVLFGPLWFICTNLKYTSCTILDLSIHFGYIWKNFLQCICFIYSLVHPYIYIYNLVHFYLNVQVCYFAWSLRDSLWLASSRRR